jgi:hypothetical protein
MSSFGGIICQICLLSETLGKQQNGGENKQLKRLLISDNYSYRSTTIKITGFV